MIPDDSWPHAALKPVNTFFSDERDCSLQVFDN